MMSTIRGTQLRASVPLLAWFALVSCGSDSRHGPIGPSPHDGPPDTTRSASPQARVPRQPNSANEEASNPVQQESDRINAAPTCRTTTVQVGTEPLGYRASGQVCKGLRQGDWEFIFLSGKPHRRGAYKDGQETGTWTLFYQSGTTRSQGRFEGGQRTGSWFRNHPNGTRSLEGVYQSGLRNGRWRRWHDNGQLYEDRIYVAGRREGIQYRWNTEGLLQYTRLCKNDKCQVQCQAKGKDSCPPLSESTPTSRLPAP